MAFLVNLLIITSRSKNINSNFSSSLIKGTKVAIFSNRLFPLKIKINRKRTTKKSNFEGIERKNKNKKQKQKTKTIIQALNWANVSSNNGDLRGCIQSPLPQEERFTHPQLLLRSKARGSISLQHQPFVPLNVIALFRLSQLHPLSLSLSISN